jgi:hypothetical protein
MFLVNVIKAHTPSCLVPTFGPLSTVEPWLLLSSSVSKLNNHEEKNITYGKFTPFSFASYYPNSPLIFYCYYPPTNDRVEAIVSLNTSLPKNQNTTWNCNSFLVSCLGCCQRCFFFSPGWATSEDWAGTGVTSEWVCYGLYVVHPLMVSVLEAWSPQCEMLRGGA